MVQAATPLETRPATPRLSARGRAALVLAAGALAAGAAFALAWTHGGLAANVHAPGFQPLYALSGLLVGLLVGLTGVGGGSLMTPLLVLLFGFHPSTAVGTDLLYAAGTKGVGAVVHSSNRTIDWKVTGLLAAGSVPATAITVLILFAMRSHGQPAQGLISTVLGFALLLTAATLLFRQRLFAYAAKRSVAFGPRTTAALTVTLGAALGTLITLSSVGAGALGVTVLIFLYPKMPMARIVGSDIAHAVPLTLIAGAGHFALGAVNLPLLGSLLVGSIPGIILGSHLTPKVPEKILRRVLACTLILVAAKLIF